ncbi:NADPH:quinone oxidoreductase family protein [Pontivivens insulae]|uniref:Alcohol dehydrogenase n=1 Tax=Pontivivens insulae TaxID=1639689 RepID=A0A2R8AC16_9RHOB|nr:NADPH:quinone oxidoreductase family protein [Pontivivens insulae]RED11063.1 NADPH:quinone reductase-like Zn-dependent oxidoreductase [Pontivivens insulae]SPF29762.1 Alcohol dehydrogenase [Pontivivens insulae]
MKAMQITELGQPLQLVDVDAPTPGKGEVSIRVAACGVNFGDTLMVKGTYQERPPLPFAPGMEICGTVEAVGEGVKGLKPGTRVAALCGSGGFAEVATAPAAACVPVPPNMSDAEVAAFLVAYGTSHVGLDYRARLKEGENLLVLGAAGGVGLTAIEIGKLMGANVIACARGAAKLEIAKQTGADHLIDSDTDDIREVVKSLGGADVVYDPVGGDQFKAAMRACNPEARLLPLGFASGDVPQIPANILLVKNLTVHGFYWGAYSKFKPEVLANSFMQLFQWHMAGKLKPHVSHQIPLADANDALDLLTTRKATGKVVVTMG